MNTLSCLDAEATFLGVFDLSIAPTLLYYAYMPTIILSLGMGFFILLSRSSFRLQNRLFFLITLVFSLYTLNEILLWIMIPAAYVYFGWQLIAVFLLLLAILLTYFNYTYVVKQDIPTWSKLLALLIAAPVFLLLSTKLNMGPFDIVYCEPEVGHIATYIHALMIVAFVYNTYLAVNMYITKHAARLTLITLGVNAMLLILFFSDALGELTGDFKINMLEPLGMLAFLSVITYAIVEFRAFSIKLAGAQALMVGLTALIGSQLFFVKTTTNLILTALTLCLAILGGSSLIRSVKKEIKHREEIEGLVKQLAETNERLRQLDKLKSEFVSIASHQLRSPITAIRGYVSLLRDGSFGRLAAEMEEPLERIDESSRRMAMAIEDYLDISLIESGNMKYEQNDFNLNREVERLCDDNRMVAKEHGLALIFQSQVRSQGMVRADVNKTSQVIQNLLNNAIKYTPEGSIRVLVHDDIVRKKIYVDVNDTGLGMSESTLANLFQKFERARSETVAKISGSGIGLFIAQKMAEGMGGRITAYSEGEGKGSRFTLELPLG